MRATDRTTGLIILTVGLGVAGYAQTFPPMPGQPVGPALFPTLIGLGLALIGAVIAASGLKRGDTPWLEFDEWARSPRALVRVALVLGALVIYTAIVDRLGFLITGTLLLSVLFAAFGVRPRSIVPLAIGVTVGIHACFYTGLGVPLPWGALEAIAW